MEEALFQSVGETKNTIKILDSGFITIVPESIDKDAEYSQKIPACSLIKGINKPGFINQSLLENDVEVSEAHLSQLMLPG
jgi:hypothetical protein